MGGKRGTIEERFWRKIDKNGPILDYRPELGPCWIWKAYIDHRGYGRMMIEKNGRKFAESAHVLSWKIAGRKIPVGLVLDHLCRNRACPNYSHLDLVTDRENILRGVSPCAVHAKKTHCKRGHSLDSAYRRKGRNGRECNQCRNLRRREQRRIWRYEP